MKKRFLSRQSVFVDDRKWKGMDLYNEKLVKARKEHHCCECGCPIERGEKYYVHSGNDGNGWWREKSHEDCHVLFQMLITETDYYVTYPSFGDLDTMIHDLVEWDILEGAGAIFKYEDTVGRTGKKRLVSLGTPRKTVFSNILKLKRFAKL